MSEFDVLFPIPQGGRNADDMGMPPAQDVGEYPTLARLADVSRTTVGYQKPDLEREAVAAFHELTRLRAALADALVDRNSYRERLSMERARADANAANGKHIIGQLCDACLLKLHRSKP